MGCAFSIEQNGLRLFIEKIQKRLRLTGNIAWDTGELVYCEKNEGNIKPSEF